ncbi:MAG: ion transporter [Proteobacteria bacterium]|uniref:ion transporter n=1 Tax=Aquabacterium sp. TaxID=1872578 RepID=UPI0035C691E4|nr:ion transporter [Pseudomonadota bacterium]
MDKDTDRAPSTPLPGPIRGPIRGPVREPLPAPLSGWRLRLHAVVFESDTRAGRTFDQVLIALILLSVTVVTLDSVASIQARWGRLFDALEWLFTALFTLEYALRLACAPRPLAYARSFFGLIDLLSILPTYFALLVPQASLFMDVRILRLLRIFRVLKLSGYVSEYTALGEALSASRRKILIFMSFVMMVVLIMGTVMYVVEGPENGFSSIPTAMYWAVTTMTTVGFGDITPKTDLGRLISALMMLLGWSVLAVPTGIVTAEMSSRRLHPAPPAAPRTCPNCRCEGHMANARHCWNCGAALPPSPSATSPD